MCNGVRLAKVGLAEGLGASIGEISAFGAGGTMMHAVSRITSACLQLGHLVFRFRSSHHFAALSSANFGIKGTLAISILSSAAYGFEVPTRDCRELIGTSNPPH